MRMSMLCPAKRPWSWQVLFAILAALGTSTTGAAPPGRVVQLSYPTPMASSVLLQSAETVVIEFDATSVEPQWQWIVLEVHSQQRPVLMRSETIFPEIPVLHSSCAFARSATTTVYVTVQHPGGADSRPILFYAHARNQTTDFVAGRANMGDATSSVNSTLSVISYKGAQYISFRSIKSAGVHYVVHKSSLTSPSQQEMMATIYRIDSSDFAVRDVVIPLGDTARSGFRYDPDPHSGSVYQVCAVSSATSGIYTACYTPLALYPCKLDSTAVAGARCQGVLPFSDGMSSVLAKASTSQQYVFNIPLAAGPSDGRAGFQYNNTWKNVILQAHSQQLPVVFSWWQVSQGGTSTPVPVEGLSLGFVVGLTNATDQITVSLKQTAQDTWDVDIPVQLRAVPYVEDIVPGKGDSTNQPWLMLSLVNEDQVKVMVPFASTASALHSPVEFDYEFYQLRIQPGATVAQITAALDSMQTAESVLKNGQQITRATATGAVPPASRPFVVMDTELDYGYVINAIVTDANTHERVAYVPITYFNCFANVSQELQHSYPCKQQLPLTRPDMAALHGGYIKTFLVENVPANNGFTVVQSHAQLHRLTAGLDLGMVQKSPQASPNQLDVLTARSTGVVTLSSGDVDYFVKSYSVVDTETLNMAVNYPQQAPVPGGCCSSGSVVGLHGVSIANATIAIDFDDTTTTVSFDDAAILGGTQHNELVCAYQTSGGGITVTYTLYELEHDGRNTSENLFNDVVRSMYTVEGILASGATVVKQFTSRSKTYTVNLPVKPGHGRAFAVIANATSGTNVVGVSAYIPAVTYDCSYVADRANGSQSICKSVLEPNAAYSVDISPGQNVSFVLNDWQASAKLWTFVVINVHSQQIPVTAALTQPATLDTASFRTNNGLLPILNPNGGNEKTDLYVSRKPAADSSSTSGSSSDPVSVRIQAVPYGESVPIPGGCCITCSLDNDPTIAVSFSGFRSNIDFYEANVGYTADEGVPELCDARGSRVSDLTYTAYKYELDYGKFDVDIMVQGVAYMSTVAMVKKHGTKIGTGDFVFHKNHQRSFMSRPGQGVIYNILVQDPRNASHFQSVYSPRVTYSCDFADGSCSDLHSLPIRIVLSVVGLMGLFLCLDGHRRYRFELWFMGGFLPLIAGFVVLNVFTSMSVTWLVVCSLAIGVYFGGVLYSTWCMWDFPHFFHLIVGLTTGALLASILFFTPFGDISIWHQSPINYWSAFAVVTFFLPVFALLMPLYFNILSTCIIGTFAFIMALTQFIDSSLSMMVVDVILHATNSSTSTNIYTGYVFSTTDLILSITAGFMVVGGYIFQLVRHRRSGRPNFPPCPYTRRGAPRSSTSRTRAAARRGNDNGGSFLDSPPMSPPPQTQQQQQRRRPNTSSTRYQNLQPVTSEDRGWAVRGQRRQRQPRPERQQRQMQHGPDTERQPLVRNMLPDEPPSYGSIQGSGGGGVQHVAQIPMPPSSPRTTNDAGMDHPLV